MRLWILLVSLIGFSLINAEVYLLTDIINSGLENSISITRSLYGRSNTLDESRINYFALLPDANYSASYTNPTRVNDYFTSTLSIGKSFYLNEPAYFNIRRSNLEKRIVDLKHENLRKKIAFDILNEYIEIVKQQKNIENVTENLNLQRRIYEQVRIQYDSRRRTIYDLQQSEIDTLNTYIQLIELNDMLSKRRENLFFLINQPDLGYPFEDYNFKIDSHINIDDFSKNLNMKSSELGLQQNKLSLRQSYLSQFPSLSVGYFWSTRYQNSILDTEFFKPNNYQESGTFSINLSYPLFNHFDTGFRYRMTRRNFNLMRYELEELEKEINQQILQIINDLSRLRMSYELYQRKLDLSRKNLQIAEERFMLGNISNLDLDKARIQFLESDFQLTNQFYTLVKKQEELNFLASREILGRW
jgi:outer membrane protein TolC